MTRMIVVIFIFVSTFPLLCQSVSEKAWNILNHGLTDRACGNRVAAAKALTLLQDDPKAQSAVEDLLRDSKPEVRAAAATSLGAMDAKSSVPKLEALLTDREASVVLAAADALYRMEEPKAYEVYYAALTRQRKSGVPILPDKLKALKDPKTAAQLGLRQGVGIIPFGAPAMSAVKTITKDDASLARAAAALRLARDPDSRTRKALLEALRDDKAIIRVAAASAIAQRNDPTLLNDLIARFVDESVPVRLAAAAGALRLQHGADPSLATSQDLAPDQRNE